MTNASNNEFKATHPGFGGSHTPDIEATDLNELHGKREGLVRKIREWIQTMQEAQENIVWNIDRGCYVNAGNLMNPVQYGDHLANLMHLLQVVEQRIAHYTEAKQVEGDVSVIYVDASDEDNEWEKLAKRSGYNTVKIMHKAQGRSHGTMQWNFQRGDGCHCWIVSRHDDEGNQVGEADYTAIRRCELADVLKRMANTTLFELDPYHDVKLPCAVKGF